MTSPPASVPPRYTNTPQQCSAARWAITEEIPVNSQTLNWTEMFNIPQMSKNLYAHHNANFSSGLNYKLKFELEAAAIIN